MQEIIVALIGLGGSALGSIIGIVVNAKLTNYRLEQLENKVNQHNNLISRTYELEKKESILSEKISVANHRIDDLEERHKFEDNKFIKEA